MSYRLPSVQQAAARARRHSALEDVLGLTTGVLLASFGLALLHAARLVTGGTAGLSLLISYTGIAPFAVVFTVVNLPFFVLGWFRRGPRFTLVSLLCVAAVSWATPAQTWLVGPLEPRPEYALVIGNLMCGTGVLILFRHGGSLGGFNIIGLLAQDRWGIPAGWILFALDATVIASSLTIASPATVGLSAIGALLLDLVLALNHRPGRYAVQA